MLASLYSLEGALFGVLAWLAHRFSLAPVLVLVFLDGVVAVTARALARATTVAVLTPAGLLREGNAVTSGSFSLCYMAGPAVGGAVVAAGGTVAALLVNCGLFAAIAVVLLTAELPPAPSERAPVAGRLRAALAQVRRNIAVRNLLGVQVVGLVFFTVSIPVTVVLAQRTLHAGPGGYGALLSAWGGGAVVGSLAFAHFRGSQMRNLIVLSAASVGVGFLVMAIAPTLAVAVAGAAFGGIGNALEVAAARTALQETTEPRWMGITMSLSESVNQATPGAGILLGGAIAAVFSARTAFAVAGAGALAIVPLAALALRRVSTDRLGRGSVSA